MVRHSRMPRKPCARWKISSLVRLGLLLCAILLGVFHYRLLKTADNVLHLTLLLEETTSRQQRLKPLPKLNHSPSSTPPPHVCFDGNDWLTLRHAPDLIIAGTQKGGTTALYALLRKHPQIVASNLFEAHFFDMHYGVMRRKYKNQGLSEEIVHCRLHQAYLERLDFPVANATSNRIWTFEKTPNYMIWPHVPSAIVHTCPWKPKIVMVLRNPVERLYSQYRMHFEQQPGSLDLESTLDIELSTLRKFQLSNAPNISQWMWNGQRNDESFQPSPIADEERDKKDSIRFRGFGNHGSNPRYLQRGMYIYQIRRWLRNFELHSELLVLPHEQLRNDMKGAWEKILNFLGAPYYPLSDSVLQTMYRPSIDSETRHDTVVPAAPLSNVTRSFLVEFYRPYNHLLADVLGEEWRGLWDDK